MGRFLDRMQLRLRTLFRRSAVDRELRRELDAHVQASIDEQLVAGASEADARRTARRAFGSVAGVEEACRDTRRLRLIDDLIRDVRYACRQLRRQPVFALAAVTAVALGVAANAAIMGLANDRLLSTPTAARADRLVHIRTISGSHVSDGVWKGLAESGALAGIAGYNIESQVNWRGGDSSLPITPLLVTPNYFDVLGVPTRLGRAFTADDVARNTDAVVVSHGFWQQHLGLAALTTRALSAFLVTGLSTTDPVSFGATAGVLVAICVAASWGPVRRALRVDPGVVLKIE